ncbi:ArsR family transcriptional regulator [Halobacteria archaeon AArc-dxtr1]|nr:ArsR family transcriptional regulator [Halobacteria archaeon AArc-dxtr1]
MTSQEEEIVRLLSQKRNRRALEILHEEGTCSLRELAVGIADKAEGASGGADERAASVDRITIELHHRILPALTSAELVSYNRENATVSTATQTDLEAEWLDVELFDELQSYFGTHHDREEGIGVVQGSEQVYEHARQMADEADEELFLIYVSDELLTVDCLPQAQRAIDRDVEFAVGSEDGGVHDFFHEHLPEATLWEPQRDWGASRTQYPRINRVIVADRQQVVVGLLDETEDGGLEETAIIGEGATNPLVVLVRELLGPRLDHLDYQSEDFLESLPFDG